ncbi:MAG: hypothetical protein Q7V61_03820 [Actinomycetota bacterium]|nr:hypothetical protein [Actinomycetota bacterium]
MTRQDPDMRWGLTRADWDTAREQARALMVARAAAGLTVTYSELCAGIAVARFIPRSWRLTALVGEVCEAEDALTGALLATIVVRQDTGRPGEGYFVWALGAGLPAEDREAFWVAQAERVWSAYRPG